MQKVKYLKNEKSFLDEMKNNFHSFIALRWARQKDAPIQFFPCNFYKRRN